MRALGWQLLEHCQAKDLRGMLLAHVMDSDPVIYERGDCDQWDVPVGFVALDMLHHPDGEDGPLVADLDILELCFEFWRLTTRTRCISTVTDWVVQRIMHDKWTIAYPVIIGKGALPAETKVKAVARLYERHAHILPEIATELREFLVHAAADQELSAPARQLARAAIEPN